MMQLMEKYNFIEPGHFERLRSYCREMGLDEERCLKEIHKSDRMEGLYIKIEKDGIVKARYKYVRASFLTAIKNAEGRFVYLEVPLKEVLRRNHRSRTTLGASHFCKYTRRGEAFR